MAMPEIHDWWSDPATREQTLRELRKLSIESRNPYNTAEGQAIMLWLNQPGGEDFAPHMDALLRLGLSPRDLLAAIPKKRGRPRAKPVESKQASSASKDDGMAALDFLVRHMRANGIVASERDALRKLCEGADKVAGKRARPDSEVLRMQQKLSRWRCKQRVAQTSENSD